MPVISGIFTDAGNNPLNGLLSVSLPQPLVVPGATPSSTQTTMLPVTYNFPITNGVFTATLPSSEVQQQTYQFQIIETATQTAYYQDDGTFYCYNTDLPLHQYTDGLYYTGYVHTTSSLHLNPQTTTTQTNVGNSFYAVVPNSASPVDFADLEATGFYSDRTPQTAQQVANILKRDTNFISQIVAFGSAGGSTVSLAAYAPLDSPALINVPTAPTPAIGTNTNQIATTAFVNTAIAPYAPIASPQLLGTPLAPTPAIGTNSNQIATTAFVNTAISPYALLASPALIGVPTAPTAVVNTNTTQIATTAFVANVLAGSPALGGIPTTTTPSQYDASTKIATMQALQNLSRPNWRYNITVTSASNSGNKTLSFNTNTEYDSDNISNGSTGGVTIPTGAAGKYTISAAATITNSGSTAGFGLILQVNGANRAEIGYMGQVPAIAAILQGSCDIALNAGDVLTLYCSTSSTSWTYGNGNAYQNYFCGHRLGN